MNPTNPQSPDPEPNAIQITKTPEGITTITINRPHRRNAINTPAATKLHAAFQSFESDPSQKVCVLHGANGTFCAGFDLHQVAKSDNNNNKNNDNYQDQDQDQRPRVTHTNHQADRSVPGHNDIAPMGPSRMQLQKPVIAAVSGYAVAGGLELSLLADLRVVEEDAVFGVFCRRWGVPLIDGGTVRLKAIVGLGRALDMILTGRAVGAAEALTMGLANRVVARGQALEEAMRIARQLSGFPQRCMNADRASCYHAAYEAGSFGEAMRFEYENGVEVVEEEGVKGAKRFSAGNGRHGRFENL